MPGMSPRIKAKKGRFGAGGLVPIINILSPADGANVAGSPSTFVVTIEAYDDIDGDLRSIATLSTQVAGSPSTLDLGTFAANGTLTVNLPAGTYVLTASVTAPTAGATSTDSITVTVG